MIKGDLVTKDNIYVGARIIDWDGDIGTIIRIVDETFSLRYDDPRFSSCEWYYSDINNDLFFIYEPIEELLKLLG